MHFSDGLKMSRYGGKVPASSEIIRQARQEILGLDTKRPQTPRHEFGSEKWREYYAAGDRSIQIDKGKSFNLFAFYIFLAEPRPAQRQSIRLNPLKPVTPPKRKNRVGSAKEKFEQYLAEFSRLGMKDRHTIADKLSKSIERLEGEMTPQEMENILTKCKEVLDLNASITNEQVLIAPYTLAKFTSAAWSVQSYAENGSGKE